MMSFRSLLRSQRSLSLRPSKKFLALHSSCSCYSASAAAIEAERTIREGPGHDWSKDDIKSIYDSPVLDLLFHGVCICTRRRFFLFFRLKFTDMLITSGKCRSAPSSPSRRVDAVRIVHIVLNPLDMTLE
ncbi:hypothetical protein AB3S75_022696 [Citrus x aurantiifolia]